VFADVADVCMPEVATVATELILTLRIVCRLGATISTTNFFYYQLVLGVRVKVSVKIRGYDKR
jgi:hypothetical protein